MRSILFTLSASLLCGSMCGSALAQQANVNLDYNPQKNTENLVPFSAPLNSPDVRDDRTVTFRLKAPEAQKVELAGVAILTALGQQKPVPFQKGDDGVWSLTVGPLRAGHVRLLPASWTACRWPIPTTPSPGSPPCRPTASSSCTATGRRTTTRATCRTAP